MKCSSHHIISQGTWLITDDADLDHLVEVGICQLSPLQSYYFPLPTFFGSNSLIPSVGYCSYFVFSERLGVMYSFSATLSSQLTLHSYGTEGCFSVNHCPLPHWAVYKTWGYRGMSFTYYSLSLKHALCNSASKVALSVF